MYRDNEKLAISKRTYLMTPRLARRTLLLDVWMRQALPFPVLAAGSGPPRVALLFHKPTAIDPRVQTGHQNQRNEIEEDKIDRLEDILVVLLNIGYANDVHVARR